MSRLERRNMRLFIVRGFNRLHFLVRVLPASKKLFSNMALDVGMHRVDRTTRANIGNMSLPLRLHHDRTWNSPLASPLAHCFISPSVTLCFMYASYSLSTLALRATTASWPSTGRTLSSSSSSSSIWSYIKTDERAYFLTGDRASGTSSSSSSKGAYLIIASLSYPWPVRSSCAQHQGRQDRTSWSDLTTTPWRGYHQGRTCCSRAAT